MPVARCDLDRGSDRLERPRVRRELAVREADGLRLLRLEAEGGPDRPVPELVVELGPVRSAVRHRDEGEAVLRDHLELGVLAVRGAAVRDDLRTRNLAQQPTDADGVADRAA